MQINVIVTRLPGHFQYQRQSSTVTNCYFRQIHGNAGIRVGVIIGGSASIKDHLTLHSGVVVGAGSGVIKDVPAGKTVLGYPAQDAKEMLKQWVAMRKLV